MEKKVRVGIVGIGFGQQVLLPAFRLVDGVEIYGIAASSLERAEHVAQCHSIYRAYSSWKSMIQDPSLDALVIAVPPDVQQDIVAEALLQNKHLFCEKPLGLCARKTNQFALEAERRKLAHMVDFEFCAIPIWNETKHLIASGTLGKLKLGLLNWHVETYAHRMKLDHWKINPKKGGGVLLQFVSHVLFNLEWLCGPITEILMMRIPSAQVDVAVHGIIRFQNELVLNISVGNASYEGSGHRLEIYGEQGSLQLVNSTSDHFDHFELATKLREGKEFLSQSSLPSIKVNHDARIAAVAVLARRFVHWIQSGEQQEPSFHHGHRVNLLIQACQASHEQRHWIAVEH